MSSKDFITHFREKIINWNNKLYSSNKFVKIYNDFVNNPEGYVSLVIEHMQGYSLQDLIENIGALNEAVLCKIAIQITQCLNDYNQKMMEDYGEFCTCDVLFDKHGNLKVIFYLIF